jgi:hypothetical protein
VLRRFGSGSRGWVIGLLLAMPWAVRAESIALREVSERWGLAFRHHHGGSGKRYMVETVVGGVVILDYDQDGDLDVYFIDGASLPGYEGEQPGSKLYRNDQGANGEPHFVDVTVRAGLVWDGYGCGGVVGDYDSDGDLDLYVTAFGANRLWRNRGDGTFEDVTARAGVGDPRWSAGAAFSDVDGDGDLDLYVAGYVDFTIETHKSCGDESRGIRAYCHPEHYRGVGDRLFLNRGGGSFRDGTEASGLAPGGQPGLGVVVADFDDDGRPDIYVANDAKPNFFFRNQGVGEDGQVTFEDLSLLSGASHSGRGKAEGGMGVAAGDADGDGRLDIVVTNFELEVNAFYRNTGDGLFTDYRFIAGLGEPSFRMLAFGVALAELDNDGDLDLVVANGHILDNANEIAEHSQYAQPNQVFRNTGKGRFELVAVPGFARARVSRGLATGDLDRDGDLDLVITNSNDAATVWENRIEKGSWLQVDLVPRPGRDAGAVGARIALESGGKRQIREVQSGGSYLSQHALTAHFGLPQRAEFALEVRWQDGGRTRVLGLADNHRIRLRRSDKGPRDTGD